MVQKCQMDKAKKCELHDVNFRINFKRLQRKRHMFKNYLKIALRNVRRQKAYAFINIAGLAMGMACCILIVSFIATELSYDRFHKNSNRIYRLGIDASLGGNQIVDISPVAGLTKLRHLTVNHNQIMDISPIAGLTNLRWLMIGTNQIVDVSDEFGLDAEIWNIENPRIEAEEHYYEPDMEHLPELGFKPTYTLDDELKITIPKLMEYKERIEEKRDRIKPTIYWSK